MSIKEVALALGGGGIRGIAHIGVIRCLEDHGYVIKAVAGTSAGGLVGSVYAAGYSTQEIEKAARNLSKNPSFKRTSHDKPSLLGVSGITKMLLDMLGETNIEDFPIPFVATAVSLSSGHEIMLNKGKAVDAVLATIAIPGILPVQEIDGKILMDGGVLDPVPVKAVRGLDPSLPILAVILYQKPTDHKDSLVPLPFTNVFPSTVIEQISKLRLVEALKIFARSVEVATQKLSEFSLIMDKPDVVIAPQVGHYALLDQVDPDALIEEGYRATLAVLPKVEKACSGLKSLQRRIRYGASLPEK